MSTDLYVVKSRRFYGGREVTSVLCAPTGKATAAVILENLNYRYQYPGNLYLEKWEKKA